jgi:hypothetical protein
VVARLERGKADEFADLGVRHCRAQVTFAQPTLDVIEALADYGMTEERLQLLVDGIYRLGMACHRGACLGEALHAAWASSPAPTPASTASSPASSVSQKSWGRRCEYTSWATRELTRAGVSGSHGLYEYMPRP